MFYCHVYRDVGSISASLTLTHILAACILQIYTNYGLCASHHSSETPAYCNCALSKSSEKIAFISQKPNFKSFKYVTIHRTSLSLCSSFAAPLSSAMDFSPGISCRHSLGGWHPLTCCKHWSVEFHCALPEWNESFPYEWIHEHLAVASQLLETAVTGRTHGGTCTLQLQPWGHIPEPICHQFFFCA